MEEKTERKGNTQMQWLVTLLANAALLSYGFQSGWLSPTTKLLQSEHSPAGRPLTYSEISWMGSLPSFAAVFGVPFFTVIADKIGRKFSVIIIVTLQGLSWMIKLISSQLVSLVLARICCGLAGAGCFNVIPLYVKEISQDDIRGTLGSMFVLIQNIGVLLMYAMGAYLEYNTVLWIVTSVPLVAAVLMIKAPESPAFLVKLGKLEEAESVIAFFRGVTIKDASVQEAMDAIKYEDNYFKSIPNVSFFTIFFKDKAWRRGLLIITAIFFAHATNGAFSIVTYASTILEASGIRANPELQSLSLPVFMIVGSLLSMSCVDRIGRKPILATAFMGSVVSLASLASIAMVQRAGGTVPEWMSMVAIALCLTMYAGGISPMPYVALSEMFNFQIRTKVVGLVVTFAYAMVTVQLALVGPAMATFGAHVAFFVFAAINGLGFVVTLTILPETKAKTVEQIEKELRKAW